MQTPENYIVATEPHITPIRIFRSNESHCFQYGFTKIQSSSDQNKENISPDAKRCKCPYILIADDDTFQHFYYISVFKSSITSESTLDEDFIPYEDQCVQTCFSGEDLLEVLREVQKCGCGKLKLVISDYLMGEDKLNGVQVCISIRKTGFSGAVILRTSESEKDLEVKHGNLKHLINKQTINEIMSKKDTVSCKNLMLNILKTDKYRN